MKPVYKTVNALTNNALTSKGYEYIEYPNGSKSWYLNGKHHREDGPAVEYPDGSKYWFLNGKCHREDGPALEWPDGTKIWYLDGKSIILKTKSNDPKILYLQDIMKIQEVLES